MSTSEVQFTILDYFFFVIVFVVSIAIGLYYARKRQHHSVDDYLFGGKKLGILPVSFSLAATSISGSSIVGQSMEVYAYGLHHWIPLLNSFIRVLAVQYLFLPIFYDLQLASSFEYLEMRFDKSVKLVASALFVITGIIIIPLTIYVPSLAFQEVTGINLYAIIAAMGLICIWYTAIGGIKAVVWTDAFQCILIFFSGITIMVVGLWSVGGIANVWEALNRGGRLIFIKTDLDMEIRGSIYAYVFSDVFISIYQFGLSQNCIQRYVSLPTLSKAKISLWVNNLFWFAVIVMQLVIGGIIYTTYEECDPLKAGFVKKFDQIFPYFVQEKASLFAGFNGIFIAGISAAGLSTTSTLLNTISGTIYCDFLASRRKTGSNGEDRSFSWIIKLIVAVVGLTGIAMVFLIERMGTIFSISTQCFAMATVSLFGLFISGMIFPKINSKGAKCGVILSMIAIGILIIGSLGKKPDPPLLLRTDGCDFANATSFLEANRDQSGGTDLLPWIFRINFQYYCLIGLVINISVGYAVSILTGGNVVKNQRLLVPFLRRKDVPDEQEAEQDILMRSSRNHKH